jgi:hypothetical protein
MGKGTAGNDLGGDGTSTATMRFAAATDTVFEPRGVLSVVAPTTPDATLADVGFNIAGNQTALTADMSKRCRPAG